MRVGQVGRKYWRAETLDRLGAADCFSIFRGAAGPRPRLPSAMPLVLASGFFGRVRSKDIGLTPRRKGCGFRVLARLRPGGLAIDESSSSALRPSCLRAKGGNPRAGDQAGGSDGSFRAKRTPTGRSRIVTG